MEKELSEFIPLCRSLGSDHRLVWAGGGNISVKDGAGAMLIKASGTELGQMTPKRGWRKVDVSRVQKLLDNLQARTVRADRIKQGLLDACCDGQSCELMPSIETFFHAVLGRCVVHLHPVAILPYLCSKNGHDRLKRIIGPQFDFHWIDFRGLGVVTAGQIEQKIRQKKLALSETRIFFLSNHGLIVSCQSAARAKAVVRHIVSACAKNLPPSKPVRLAAKGTRTQTARRIQSVCNQCCEHLSGRVTVAIRALRTPKGLVPRQEWFRGIITPEELTYLGAGILWLENDHPDTLKKRISIHFRKTGFWPGAFYVAGQGLFVSDRKEKLPLYQRVFAYYLGIRGRAMCMGGLRPLASKYLSGEGL